MHHCYDKTKTQALRDFPMHCYVQHCQTKTLDLDRLP